MRRSFRLTLGAVVFLFGALAFAQDDSIQEKPAVPRLVRFSGTLRDATGKNTQGVQDVTFSLYATESGGEALWFETQTLEVDALGRYTVLLGAMHPDGLPMDLFTSGEARWLGVSVGKLPEQARVLLVSVPYALKAGDSESLGGKPAGAYALQGQTGASVLAVGGAAKSDAAQGAALANTTQTQSNALVTSGQTHFTGTTTDYMVRITQSGTGRGLYGLSQSGEAVYGQILGTSGTTYAVRGLTPSTTGAGVFGSNTAITGAAYGVRGNTTSTGGAGVAGFNTATTGSAIGVIGQTSSTTGIALFGRALAATGATVGLQGIADSTSGTGINSQATAASGTTTGLFAKVNSASGTALIVDNAGGGKIASLRNNGAEKFSVGGTGNVTSSGTFTGNGSALTNLNAANLTNGLTIQPSVTDTSSPSCNMPGPCVSANVLAGYMGVSGGNSITAGVTGATIAGGGGNFNGTALANKVTDDGGTVGGGVANQAGDNAGTVSDHCCATVAGGVGNTADGDHSTVAGGLSNHASGIVSIVGGGDNNTAGSLEATVAGGYGNTANNQASTVGGGDSNTASGLRSTVAGGAGNTASGDYAAVIGGQNNTVNGYQSIVAGGAGNIATLDYSTVAGGKNNAASGQYSTVAGGQSNTASGYQSIVAGGAGNTASGYRSFAAGCSANAANNASFVWSGATTGGLCTTVSSSADSQFIALAPGGVIFYSNTGLSTGVSLAAGGGSWASLSDRNMKDHLEPVNGQTLLARLNAIPMASWNYKAQPPAIRHLGPMAQDFYAAFGLGEDDKHITTVDEGGVALAAIQELYRLSLEKDKQIQELREELKELRAQVAGR